MLILQGWQNFYMLTGAAAATLIGLLFVAVTIGGYIPAQRAIDYLQTFVTPTLLYYFQVLLIACLVIMPLQSSLLLSVALLILGGISCYLAGKVFLRTLVLRRNDAKVDIDRWHWLWHIVLPCIAGLLLIASAIGFFIGEHWPLATVAIVQLLNLAISVHNSWLLTIWLTLRSGVKPGEMSDAGFEERMKEAERLDA